MSQVSSVLIHLPKKTEEIPRTSESDIRIHETEL